jgi:hypothetical protein
MTGWDRRPHRTAAQKRRDRDPVARKVDRANLAPSQQVTPNECQTEGCGHLRLLHESGLRLCIRCDCKSFTAKEAT